MDNKDIYKPIKEYEFHKRPYDPSYKLHGINPSPNVDLIIDEDAQSALDEEWQEI